jgi:putative oxidoreductase
MSNTSSTQAWGVTVLRVAVAIVFLMHGGQKLFVYGFHGVAGFMGQLGIPLPGFSAVVVTLVEFFGGLALLFGVATRLAALLLAIDMAVAVLAVHLRHGYFLPMGFEFALTMLLTNIALLLTGAGAASVDGLITKRS